MTAPVPAVRIVWLRQPAPFPVAVYDAATGRDYTPEILSMELNMNSKGMMTADLLMLVDADDRIAAPGAQVLLDPSGSGYRRGSFRFTVADVDVVRS